MGIKNVFGRCGMLAASVCVMTSSCGASPKSVATPQGANNEPAEVNDRSSQRSLEYIDADDVLPIRESAVAEVRQLQFLRPVKVYRRDEKAIRAFVEEDLSASQLAKATSVYEALGMLAPGTDIRALLLDVLAEQIVGYFDVKRHHMVVREDLPKNTETELVFAHELIHALQADHFELQKHLDEQKNFDADNAFRALVEGDATLGMLGWFSARSHADLRVVTEQPEQLRMLFQLSSGTFGQALDRAPKIVKESLMFSYLEGLIFCATLYRKGGFEEVNKAYAHPPESTEQVLHPKLYFSGERPVAISGQWMKPFEPKLGTLIASESLGELEMGIYFSMALPQTEAKRAAAGWGGDSIRVYERKGKTQDKSEKSWVWESAWDSAKEAVEAEKAFRMNIAAIPNVLEQGLHCGTWRQNHGVLAACHHDPGLIKSLDQAYAKSAALTPRR